MRTFSKCLALLLAAAMLLALAGCQQPGDETTSNGGQVKDPIDDNYRTFYQIFVGSFSDSNGDGFGDLQGIIDRFDYLNDGDMNSETSLGVQGIWLSPIFQSPSYHKYDAKDYYQIDWRFGTEETLKALIELCHSRNVKLILDLAINHTSSQHEWFLQFKQARIDGDTANPYYDYYACVTAEEKVAGRTYQKIAGVDCWYECNFSGDMPELNFDNPAVRQATLDIAKYYLDLGVDGFRFDAVKYIYFGDTASSVDFWEWYMQELKALKPDIYCVGECWSGEAEILEYYSAMNCFNFAVSQAEGVVSMAARGGKISQYTGYMISFQEKVEQANPEGMMISFLSNHDMNRIAGSFLLERNMRMAANLYLLAPGSPVIYYGEEIGMRGSRGGADTDANRRLAMLWGDENCARDPVGSSYPKENQIQTTVADQLEDENSLLRYYCRLLSIRHRYPAIARGTYQAVDCERNLGGFLITYQGENLVVLHNNSDEPIAFDLKDCDVLTGWSFSRLCEVIGSGNASLNGTQLTIDGGTSVLIQ